MRRDDEARSLTVVGISVLAVFTVFCLGVVGVLLAGIKLADQGTFPPPATILLLLLGFVLFIAPRGRRVR